MRNATYKDAVKYLESFIGKVVFKVDKEYLKHDDPLERMRVLLSLLDNPQNKFKSILLGGTSGKGSTAYLISHILTTSGYKTGLTISPHLQKINERLQINNQSISDEGFLKLLNTSILSSIKVMSEMSVGKPSYFEILIAMAFLYFAKEKVDIAVVEVGMGGEFDATNTLHPLIAVLTNVSLDHTNILGGTVQKIARTKAGIIKSIKYKVLSSKYKDSLTVISGIKQPSVIKIIGKRCKKEEAQLFLLQREFDYKINRESLDGINFDFQSDKNSLESLDLSLKGEFQAENASLAIKTVLELKKFGFNIDESAIRQGLSTAFFPGRFEYIIHNTKYKILLDGAHNPTKMKAFLSALKKLFSKERKVFIVAFKFDKDIPKMLSQIIKTADEIIVTEFQGKIDTAVHASAKARDLKSLIFNLKSDSKVVVEKDSKKALEKGIKAIQQFNNPAILIVTGSLYLVGEIRNML